MSEPASKYSHGFVHGGSAIGTFNPKYSVNEFNYKYKNYQSQKENEEVNSSDTIHGESRFTLFNKAIKVTASIFSYRNLCENKESK